jgi:carboxypeptidase C (cathepsin A)
MRAAASALLLLLAAAPAGAAPTVIAPIARGDEPILVTRHAIHVGKGLLRYEALAGRLPIRNDESGEVRGHVFFTAYRMPSPAGKPRPVTFLWNGGPTVASLPLHFEMFGPRRLEGGALVENLDTLLTVSDLVFYDPIGTGFSRPEDSTAEEEFYSTLGDFAATAEFVRAWRDRFDALRQPLFLAGESYGTWRVSGVAGMLAKAGVHVSGALLISGGIPGSQMPDSFSDAMYVPARTAAAFQHRKLGPELMRDRAATLRQASDWAANVYRPALDHRDSLGPEEREKIAGDLARFTGIRPDLVDRKSLVVSNRTYLQSLFDGDKTRALNTFDMRRFGPDRDDPSQASLISDYFRRDLGYATDLAYTGIEDGYMPRPGPERRSTGSRWSYNHVEITPAMMARAQAGGGPPGSLPWLQDAMRLDPGLRIFVAAGRFDSLNMCEGNLAMTAKLGPALAGRFTNRCYEGGHMMYRDAAERRRLAEDVRRFVAGGPE